MGLGAWDSGKRLFHLMRWVAGLSHQVHTSLMAGVHRVYRGIPFIRKRPLPYDHYRVIGIGLQEGPRRGVFPVSEVPLQGLVFGKIALRLQSLNPGSGVSTFERIGP